MAQLHVYPDGIETVPEEILNSKIFLTIFFRFFWQLSSEDSEKHYFNKIDSQSQTAGKWLF